MRKYTLYLLLAGWGLLAAACYEDTSSLPTNEIPPVEIEVPEAIATSLSVVHNARLDVTGIRITKAGKESPEELTFEWHVSRTQNGSEPILLATTRELHEVIDLPISSDGYYLILTVTDTEHDLQYLHRWMLYVTAQYNEGLVLAYTADGTTSDLALIMHPRITYQYTGAGQGTVEKELIRRTNGAPFPAPVTHLLYTYDKDQYRNTLWVSTPDDLMRVETDYYEILGHNSDYFVYPPERLDIRNILNTYQCTMILNDGAIYETLLSRGRISTPVTGTEGMSIDNNVVSAHSAPGSTRKPSTIFYDREQGKFCYGYNQSFYACASVTSGVFDPGAAPGLRSVAGGISIDNATHTLLMRDERAASGSKYRLYTFANYSASAGAPTARLIYEIPEAANDPIDRSVTCFFSRLDPVLYIVTEDGIYKVIFEAGAVAFDPAPVFTPPPGEHITLARLYVQGYYAMENYDGSASYGGNATQAWSSRAVIVVTSKDDMNDKVHIVPQVNYGSGQLDPAEALVFDGLGKILDFTVAGLYGQTAKK